MPSLIHHYREHKAAARKSSGRRAQRHRRRQHAARQKLMQLLPRWTLKNAALTEQQRAPLERCIDKALYYQ